jgi:hypothetical protein
MAEFVPLNQSLYAALMRRFGSVRVSNEGQEVLIRLVKNPYDLHAPSKEEELESGEYYRVNCPYCQDTRHRLYVNYRWNTVTRDGKKAKGLAHCFNEKCDMLNLDDELKGYVARSLGRGINTAYRKPEPFKPVEWPGKCIPLDQLPVNHAAVRYIQLRQFDPAYLAKEWDVRYCVEAGHDLVRDRLIIPVYWEGKLVGWQARAIGDRHAGPKYYTMPGLKKTQMLFNGDRAKTFKFGVVVESVFGAFRVGPRAVALLGKSMSWLQRELAVGYWGMGAMCVLLDPDAVEDMENITSMLNPSAFRWGAWSMTLPDGKDPDEFPSQELWDMIVTFARNRNIALAQV